MVHEIMSLIGFQTFPSPLPPFDQLGPSRSVLPASLSGSPAFFLIYPSSTHVSVDILQILLKRQGFFFFRLWFSWYLTRVLVVPGMCDSGGVPIYGVRSRNDT